MNHPTKPSGHLPVLVQRWVESGFPLGGRLFLDGTFGLGGHTRALLEHHPQVTRCLALDRDPLILERSRETCPDPRIERIHARASTMREVLSARRITGVDGILLDLGVSSVQLDEPGRGFSFLREGPLDMRMDPTRGRSAADLVNEASADELARLFREFGEERFAGRIAHRLVATRAKQPFRTTIDLAGAVAEAVPAPARRRMEIHPATRVFQALRIAVNEELTELAAVLRAIPACLNAGGRVAIISFHSLEDRMVKTFLADAARTCRCPPQFPVCTCSTVPLFQLITHKPLVADAAEIETNPRSRSARLRIAERLPNREVPPP
jgi:16S rRNA (cytosine1402-N4)-methyltransferase